MAAKPSKLKPFGAHDVMFSAAMREWHDWSTLTVFVCFSLCVVTRAGGLGSSNMQQVQSELDPLTPCEEHRPNGCSQSQISWHVVSVSRIPDLLQGLQRSDCLTFEGNMTSSLDWQVCVDFKISFHFDVMERCQRKREPFSVLRLSKNFAVTPASWPRHSE
jgi:hypothetical protein